MTENAYAKIRALLVDDSAFARNVGRRILNTAGVGAILEASNGQEALYLLKQTDQPIHVVFCDLMMPDMDGVQFIRHVVGLAVRPAFALVSGADGALLNTVENVARARKVDILGIIQKPLTLATALRVLAGIEQAAPAGGGGKRNAPGVTAEDLEVALAQEQFLLHFQPKISCADGVLDGFESLARWREPERGLIPPDLFIPVAEKSGLIDRLTDRTMTLAMQQVAAWAGTGLHTKVSVNLSAYMLVDTDLPDRLIREVARFGINPQQLILEITESGLFQDAANTLEILARLHMKGFPLSIDDFGTGYSSMEQLSRVPFAEMKIDGAFVRGVSENPRAKAILESSVNLGRTLGLTVVAEGAETQEDWDMLRKVGVDLVQGYFIAKPMAAEHVQPWLSEWEVRPDLKSR